MATLLSPSAWVIVGPPFNAVVNQPEFRLTTSTGGKLATCNVGCESLVSSGCDPFLDGLDLGITKGAFHRGLLEGAGSQISAEQLV